MSAVVGVPPVNNRTISGGAEKISIHRIIANAITKYNFGPLRNVSVSDAVILQSFNELNIRISERVGIGIDQVKNLAGYLVKHEKLNFGDGQRTAEQTTEKLVSAITQILVLDRDIFFDIDSFRHIKLDSVFDRNFSLTSEMQERLSEIRKARAGFLVENLSEHQSNRDLQLLAHDVDKGRLQQSTAIQVANKIRTERNKRLAESLEELREIPEACEGDVIERVLVHANRYLSSSISVAFIDTLVRITLNAGPTEKLPVIKFLLDQSRSIDYNPNQTSYQGVFSGNSVSQAAQKGLAELKVAIQETELLSVKLTAGDRSHPNLARFLQRTMRLQFARSNTTAYIIKVKTGDRQRADSMSAITKLAFEIGDELIVEVQGESSVPCLAWLISVLTAPRDKTQPLWTED